MKKGRSIRASDAAFTLIDAVPAAIADPGTTAVWEQALDAMIEGGQLTLDVFIGKQAAWISQLIAQYGSTSLSIKVPQGPACPQCGAHAPANRQERPVLVVQSLPDCKGTLPVATGVQAWCLASTPYQWRWPQRRLTAPVPREPCPPSAWARVPHACGRPSAQRLLAPCASRPAGPGRGT